MPHITHVGRESFPGYYVATAEVGIETDTDIEDPKSRKPRVVIDALIVQIPTARVQQATMAIHPQVHMLKLYVDLDKEIITNKAGERWRAVNEEDVVNGVLSAVKRLI